MDAKLKYATDMVMDAFDDAVLTVPGTKAERIVALADVLLPRLIDRAIEAGPVNSNHDLDGHQLSAMMRLLRQCIEDTPGCVAAAVVRIKADGQVMVAGSSTGLRDEFLQQLGAHLKAATYAFCAGKAGACSCPACSPKSIILGMKGEA